MGQLYILDFTKRGVDITKSRRHRDGGPSLLDVSAYNATPMGMKHPKGPDGRFVDGHPSVGALGDLPDFVGSLSDTDLKRADEHANSLIRALTAEKGRRGVAAMAAAQKAKPLKATRPAKEIPAELAERVEAIRKRPIPSDRAYLDEQLPKLTVAQLGELGRFGDWADLPPVGKTKADKVQDVIRRLTNRLTSEAVTHQSSAKGRDHYDEYRRRLAAAEARGDRDEYAALVAGFGTGGTGPGLPPEKVPPKQDFSVASDPWEAAAAKPNPAKPLKATTPKLTGHLTPATHDVIAGMIANPISADRERLKTMLSAMTLPQIKQVSERHGNGNLLGANKEQKVNQLVEHLIGHRLNSAAIQGGNWNGGARMDAIASIAANPKSGDQERLAGWLNNLKASELPEVAAKYGVKLTGRTKKEKIDQLVDDLVQNKLNSQAIRGGVTDLGKPSQRAKKEPTHLDTPRRTSGDGQFHGDHYHGDGQMGSVIERLKPDQARINVGGKRLDDALADVIIMGHSGEKGVSARQVQEWKRIAAQVEPIDADAARRINQAVANIAAVSNLRVDQLILPSTPEPLAQLMREVNFAAANYFEPDGELIDLAEMARKWDIGEMSALQMINGLQYFSPRRHESQEGFFEVRAAAQRAAKALEASGFRKTPRRRPNREAEVQSTRNALEEAKANLVSQYGEDPDSWPEARVDREVEAYYDLLDKLRRLEGKA